MLMKLEILDEATGVCLFDKTWKWPVPGKTYASLCKLVKSLFLIAKSIQAGSVNFVDFDVNNSDKMRLSCRQDQGFIMGLFHSSSDSNDAIDRFMLAIKEEFTNKYNALHDSLQKEIKQIAEECAEPEMTEDDILEQFKGFNDSLNQCVKEIFPNHAEQQAFLSEEGVSETEESDSRKTSEKSKETKQEPKEEFDDLMNTEP